jgi:hypothetical protein
MGMIRSILFCAMFLVCAGNGMLYSAEKWPGVDDTVVNRIAREHGHEERPSLIPTAEGDLQLFMFLMAGVVGGFVAGYYWRVLLEGENKSTSNSKINTP